jgi:hypothetical protein
VRRPALQERGFIGPKPGGIPPAPACKKPKVDFDGATLPDHFPDLRLIHHLTGSMEQAEEHHLQLAVLA